MEEKAVIEVRNVKKIYHMGQEKIRAVDNVSFTVNKGEFCCLLGTSGSGKSTLLNLMAGIEKLTSGEVIINGCSIGKLNENRLARFRQENLGFVFQSYNLIGSMTALENVEFPLVFKRVAASKRKKMAKQMLKNVGLKGRINHKPKEMSGGQQQRVGIARAFVAKPAIVFADEPTGNLDSKTTTEVMELIKQMAKENNQTVVMVTHDRSLTAYADKIINILDGKIQSIEVNARTDIPPTPAADTAEPAAGKVPETGMSEPAADVIPDTGITEPVADGIPGMGTAEPVADGIPATDTAEPAEDEIPATDTAEPVEAETPEMGKAESDEYASESDRLTKIAESSWEKAKKKIK